MTDYEKISGFMSLYEAHLKSRRGKQDKREVIEFEMDLARNLWQIKDALDARQYQMLGYYSFTIKEPKERQIYAAHYQDRVVQHSICDNVLVPALSRRLIYDNAACQTGKGTHFAMRRLSRFLLEHYRQYGTQGYVLKCDIHKYFQNIDHQVLKERLRRVIQDLDVYDLLCHFIDSYETTPGCGAGIPLGNQCSQGFAVFYLDGLDRLVKEKLRVKWYTRYMDDFILVHPDRDYLRSCLRQIEAYVTQVLRLELNPKTGIFPLKNGVEYLGFRFYLTDSGKLIRKVRTQTKRRFKRRLKNFMEEYAAGELEYARIKSSLASYQGHFKHGTTYAMTKNALRDFVLVRPAAEFTKG